MSFSASSPVDDHLKSNRLRDNTTEQVLLSCNIAYLSTEWLTPVNPYLGATFITIASLVSYAVNPIIESWLIEYRQYTLVSKASKMLDFGISGLTAKVICFAFGLNITFKQIMQVSSAFLVAVIVVKYAIAKFNEKWT